MKVPVGEEGGSLSATTLNGDTETRRRNAARRRVTPAKDSER